MPDALLYLLKIVTRQDTEDNRSIIRHREIHDSARSLVADVVEVWGISSYDDAETEDEIVFFLIEEFSRKTWDLEYSRN